MSSTDLADERMKHDIELAEKEALEHSILQKIAAPMAKITHKGLETIEDLSGQRASDAREEDERMEREKRERERQARMRKASVNHEGSPFTPVEPSPLSATFPTSNSPVVSQVSSAPAPTSHSPTNIAGPSFARSPVRPLFVPMLPAAPNDGTFSGEGGLSFSDLIDLDKAGSKEGAAPSDQPGLGSTTTSISKASDSPVTTAPSGPSPFTPSQPAVQASNFDLGSFWKSPDDAGAGAIAHSAGLATKEESNEDDELEDAMDIEEEQEEDHDDALDAILAQGKVKGPVETLSKPPSLDALPTVWTGHVSLMISGKK